MSELVDGGIFGEGQPCFGCSPTHPHGLRLRFERDGDAVMTRFTPTDLQQGPPGIMHGGLVTLAADELGAWAVILLREKFGFTADLTSKFVKPVRVGVEVVGRASIARDGRRVVRVVTEMSQRGERVYQGELTFVLLDRGGAEKLLGGPIPEAWTRFCR